MPVLILVIIAIPSFKLLYYMDVVPETELTIKATGHQWYWSYEYPDNGNFTFDAYMIATSDLQPGQLRLLEADNRMVVPVTTNVRIQTTATDVIHSWAVPQFGVKVDAVPGRLNELWIKVDEPGTYYGQCSRAVRRQSRLHADHGPGGRPRPNSKLGRGSEDEIRPRRRGRHDGCERDRSGQAGELREPEDHGIVRYR